MKLYTKVVSNCSNCPAISIRNTQNFYEPVICTEGHFLLDFEHNPITENFIGDASLHIHPACPLKDTKLKGN